MKKVLLTILVITALNISLNAQSRGFGIGIVFGEPTGISLKLWDGGTTAFQGAIAWSMGNRSALRLQADHLWHFSGIPVSRGKLPVYVGLGLGATFSDDLNLSARIPVGLDYQFGTVPLDIFVELVPGLNLTPSTDFNLDAGLGIRYFLN